MKDVIIADAAARVYKQNRQDRAKKEDFAKLWANSISGEEFVKQAHQHIEELYAAAGKK